MQNSEFDYEPTDSTTAIEEVDRKWKIMFLKSILLFLALPLSMTLLLVFPNVIPDAVALAIFVLAFIVTFVGTVFAALSSARRRYVLALRKLPALSPPEPRVTDDYAIMAIEKVYVFVWRKAPYSLYFVAFDHSDPTTDSQIHVPKRFWKRNSFLQIEGFSVLDQEGTFTIPTPEGEYITGEGHLLVLPIITGRHLYHIPDMDRSHLLAVVEYASKLASGESIDF